MPESAPALLRDYFALQERIFAHFGYREDWRVLPLADHTGYHWMLQQEEGGGGWVAWSPDPFTRESVIAGRRACCAGIYTQRHLPRWVYPAADCTLVSIDTRTDGNQLLAVFSNDRQCHDPELIALWGECWGDMM